VTARRARGVTASHLVGGGAGGTAVALCVCRATCGALFIACGAGGVGVRVCHEHASTVVRRVSCAAVYSLLFLAAAWMSVDGSGGRWLVLSHYRRGAHDVDAEREPLSAVMAVAGREAPGASGVARSPRRGRPIGMILPTFKVLKRIAVSATELPFVA